MIQVELTLDELAMIAQALGIAEQSFTNMHRHGVDLAIVRGVSEKDKTEQVQHALDYHNKACQFADVAIKIKNLHDENIPVPGDDMPKLKECYFCGKTGAWTAQMYNPGNATVSAVEKGESPAWADWCEFCLLPDRVTNNEMRRPNER